MIQILHYPKQGTYQNSHSLGSLRYCRIYVINSISKPCRQSFKLWNWAASFGCGPPVQYAHRNRRQELRRVVVELILGVKSSGAGALVCLPCDATADDEDESPKP